MKEVAINVPPKIVMGIFTPNGSKIWHKKVEETAREARLTDVVGFPWSQLQCHTDEYVETKKKLPPEQVEQRLLGLIRTHSRKEVAIAACARQLSPQSLKAILGELDVGIEDSHGADTYMLSIVAASHIKPGVISEADGIWAKAIFAFPKSNHSSESLAQHLRDTLQRLSLGTSHVLLLHRHIIAYARQVCSAFVANLETLSVSNQWLHAYETAFQVLASVPAGRVGTAEPLFEPQGLLDGSFPRWRIWANWRPRLARLQLWHRTSFERRAFLAKFMALEGPDFSGHGQGSLREGLIQRASNLSHPELWWGDVRINVAPGIQDEANETIDRFMRIVDHSCTADHDYVAFFLDFCRKQPVTATTMTFLEDLKSVGNAKLSYLFLHLQTGDGQMDDIAQMMPIIKSLRSQPLREFLGPFLVSHASNHLEKMQVKLLKLLDSNCGLDDALVRLFQYRATIRGVSWLLPMLDPSLRNAISNVPARGAVRALTALRTALQTLSSSESRSLGNEVQDRCRILITSGRVDDDDSVSIVPTMIDIWQRGLDHKRQCSAIIIAQSGEFGLDLQRQCLAEMANLPDEMVSTITAVFQGQTRDKFTACVNFMRLYGPKPIGGCWRRLIYSLFVKYDQQFVEIAIADGVVQWLDLLMNIQSVFQDMMDWYSPTLLKPDIHAWTQSILSDDLMPILKAFEKRSEKGQALQCLLTGSGCQESLLGLLRSLEASQSEHWQGVAENTITMLKCDGSNARDLAQIVSFSSQMTPKGSHEFLRTLHLNQGRVEPYAKLLTTALLQDPDLNFSDCRAIRHLATYLGLEADLEGAVGKDELKTTAEYLEDQCAALMVEAQRLESLRLSLRAVQPREVSRLLAKLNIEVPSIVDDILAILPSALVDVVRKIGNHQVELQFPVDHLTKLQSRALGAPGAQGFLVRLIIPSEDLPAGFCVHTYELGKTPANDDHQHTPWVVGDFSTEPSEPYCRGLTNRGEFQLSRILYRNLRKGFTSVAETYTELASEIDHLMDHCVVCGLDHGVPILRSSICESPNCAEIYLRASYRILLADVWHDAPVMNLLLTAVYASASASDADLLNNLPTSDRASALQMLSDLPGVSSIQKSLETFLGGTPAESVSEENTQSPPAPPPSLISGFLALASEYIASGTGKTSLIDASSPYFLSTVLPTLAWACTNYGGYLATASGQLRVPMFPEDHQFLVANSSPALEKAFSVQFKTAQSTSSVLFHGTSLDRLYPILSQGLRVCSGTSLQRHGAAHGSGIYMAEEPSTSWGYARNAPSVSALKWSSIKDMHVLLGCELAGASTAGYPGIHVISDASRLIVRYVFLMPPSAQMPLARHVVPAMQSVFASLRSRGV